MTQWWRICLPNLRDTGSIPESGRSLGEGNGNPPQYSCLGNPMDKGAWWATVYGVAKGWAWLTDCAYLPHQMREIVIWPQWRQWLLKLLIRWYTTLNLIQTIAIDVLISEKTLTLQEHSKRGSILSLQFPEGVRIPPQLRITVIFI